MKNVSLALATAALLSLVAPLHAQTRSEGAESMQALRAAVAQDKKGYIVSTLALTEAEAKKFSPIFDDYQRALEASDRKRARAFEALVATDKPISDAYAKTLSAEMLMSDDAEFKARRQMHTKVMRALPDKKAAQYLQLEARLRAAKLYDIAAAMPVIK